MSESQSDYFFSMLEHAIVPVRATKFAEVETSLKTTKHKPCVATAVTVFTLPKSTCSHWFLSFEAHQAPTRFMLASHPLCTDERCALRSPSCSLYKPSLQVRNNPATSLWYQSSPVSVIPVDSSICDTS